MKKIAYLTIWMIALLVGFSSCEKEEVGGTATEKFSGEWYVTVDLITTDGEIITSAELAEEEIIKSERAIIRTFNTAANVPDKFIVSDVSGAYSIFSDEVLRFSAEANLDQSTGTFSTSDYVTNLVINNEWKADTDPIENKYAEVRVYNGKITFDGGKQNNGSVSDAIEFDVAIKNNYADITGFWEDYDIELDHFHVSGVRYSGLVEND
jgi:hypothetical protein